MTDKLRQAARQALEALEEIESYYSYDRSVGALASSMYEASNLAKITSTRIREALAEQPAEQEPVAHLYRDHNGELRLNCITPVPYFAFPVYTSPQPAKQPQEPSAFGVLFAVEEAIRNGDCPWQIEQAFDEYEAERRNNIKEGS